MIVESFLRQVRGGGALDPEPHLAGAEELRSDLAPLLANVLRMESLVKAAQDEAEQAGDTVEAGGGTDTAPEAR